MKACLRREERVEAAAHALGDEGQAEVGIGRAVDALLVGVNLDGRAGELVHRVVVEAIHVLPQPAGAEKEVGENLLLELEIVVGGAHLGEIGLEVVVFRQS